MTDIRISNWNELQERLFQNAWDEGLGRYRSRYAFRGLSRASYELKTSLQRLGPLYAELERHSLRNFRKYAHRDAAPGDSVWSWLSVAQHHGLPTRLMDWTYSPYIAMHFATVNIDRFNEDAAIWCVNYEAAHLLLPERLSGVLTDEGAHVFTVEMLGKAAGTLEEFQKLGDREFVVFLEPPSLDSRIVNQYALFSVMSSASASFDQWLHEFPDLWFRVIVPAELKWEIRDKLDQANITERVLFPGMDGLSLWLKRHYSPRR